MKSISQSKKKRKLVQIGTKLGENTIFFHIIYYVDNGKDYIEVTQILGTPKWEFEILKLSNKCTPWILFSTNISHFSIKFCLTPQNIEIVIKSHFDNFDFRPFISHNPPHKCLFLQCNPTRIFYFSRPFQ